MMLLADVTKIKCKFVTELVTFLNKRKYAVDTCIEDKYTYYADALKVLYGIENSPLPDYAVSDCLVHDDECDLTTKANKYSSQVSCQVGTACNDQATITLNQNTRTCVGTASTNNTNCSCKYPRIVLNNSSELITAFIDVNTTFSGTCANPPSTSTYEAEAGCTSTGCDNAYLGIYSFGFNSDDTPQITSASFLTQMKVFKTDSFGTGATPVTLNLNPVTSPYLADDPILCPGCTPVIGAELVFGHANFTDAFATLMDNVSLALFNGTGYHRMSAEWRSDDKLRIRCTAVHNPTSFLFGLLLSGSQFTISNPTVPTYTNVNAFGDDDVFPYHRPIRFYEVLAEVTAPTTLYSCADINATIGDQVTYPNFNTNLSGFNKIVLNTSIGMSGYPVEVTSGDSTSCSTTFLSAIYTTAQVVDNVEWLDPSNNQISTSTLATASAGAGTYTFNLTLTNGCTFSETILVD